MTIGWIDEPGKPTTTVVAGLESAVDAASWCAEHHEELRRALTVYGALFLRGLPIHTTADFAAVRDALFTRRAAYQEKATPRSNYGDDVFSSTDLPAGHAIRMHNENSYTLTFPGLLLFGCLTAPEDGGATPVADVREVLRHVPDELLARFRGHGWRLTRNYAEHLSLNWRTALAADSREDAERYLADNDIEAVWGADDTLRTSQRRAATIRHPETGAEVWFNHVAFWNEWSLEPDIREVLIGEFGREGLPFNTFLGDGTPLTEPEAEILHAAYEKATVRRAWQPGDLLLVDNVLAAHGRDPFRGDRRILVGMGEPTALSDCSPSADFASSAMNGAQHV